MEISSRPTSQKKGKLAKKSQTEIRHQSEIRYSSSKMLGQGGMKKIEVVRDEGIKRKVAKATLHPTKIDDVNITHFLREARLTAALEHPNIVPIYDIGSNEDGEPFFIMKYLDGCTLAELIDRFKDGNSDKKNKYPVKRLVYSFRKVCQAIAFAHSKGVLHLDLKPSNIHITENNHVYVIDWGLSKIIGEESKDEQEVQQSDHLEEIKKEAIDQTMVGVIKGSPGYMAPEQIVSAKLPRDYRTDVYALGGILYTIMTKESPIATKSVNEMLTNTVRGKIIPPSERNPDLKKYKDLEKITMKALTVNPKMRYQSVNEMIEDIDKFFESRNINIKNIPQKESLVKNKNPQKLIWTLTAVIFSAVIVSFLLQMNSKDGTETAPLNKSTDSKPVKTIDNTTTNDTKQLVENPPKQEIPLVVNDTSELNQDELSKINPISQLEAVRTGPTTIELSWATIPGLPEIKAFKILRGPDNNPSVWKRVKRVSGEFRFATLEQVSKNRTILRIQSIRADGTSFKESHSIVVPAYDGVIAKELLFGPGAHSLKAERVKPNAITLSWQSPKEKKVVEYRIVEGQDNRRWKRITQVKGSMNSIILSNIKITTAHLQVRAMLSEDRKLEMSEQIIVPPFQSIENIIMIKKDSPENKVYEAETAKLFNAKAIGNHIDFYMKDEGYAEWTIETEREGKHDLIFLYAHADSKTPDRPLKISQNGKVISERLSFLRTPSWKDWQYSKLVTHLTPGKHTIRATVIDSSGPDIDCLIIRPSEE